MWQVKVLDFVRNKENILSFEALLDSTNIYSRQMSITCYILSRLKNIFAFI